MIRSSASMRQPAIALLALLAACGGGGGDGATEPRPTTGSLIVTIAGLPTGAPAAVTITGPGSFSRTVTATETITSLTPGSYTVTSAPVTAGDGRYAASPSSQPIAVVAGTVPAVATVTYALASGSLTVTINGLAAGTNASVTVTGPGGFSRCLTATLTLTLLDPGTYTIAASEVATPNTRFAAQPATQTATVTAAATPSAVTVTYSAASGSLALTILGLPTGSDASVSVTGPSAFSRTLTATTTLALLAPGDYVVTSADVQTANFTYRGTGPASRKIAVPASTVAAAVTVSYQAIDGALTVTIAGLPTGGAANVSMTGPAGFSATITATQTRQRLAVGNYSLTAAPVNTASGIYDGTPDTPTVTVTAGTTTSLTVTYALSTALRLQPVASGLSRPLQLLSPPNENTRFMVVEQTGRIRLIKNGQLLAQPFLDLTARIFVPQLSDDERGALGIAFHPQYATNGQFFVYYISSAHSIVVERFQVSANPDVAQPNGSIVLSLPKSDPYHNGGALAFGPDGYLYIGIGDGECCNDPNNNGQSTNTLFAKILRIDVSTTPYSVPPTNPFVGQSGRRGEIWAYGLRNPWRIDIDAAGGTLYIGDVGEDSFEEVNALGLTQAGVNLGWNTMEGPQCRAFPGCSTQGLTPPVLSYSHAVGCSIIGGYVYRGTQLPELTGHYFYSDLCSGFLRSFRFVNGAATQQRDWGIPSPGFVTSFGKDANGELYMLTLAGGVFRIARQ